MENIARLISSETGLSENSVLRIASSAPLRYKTYFIAKRNGGRRKISQPARELKLVQRALVNILLRHLPVHECATAYIPGKSIYDNALPHAGRGPIIKIDFTDFFPSIKKSDWVDYCEETQCLTKPNDIEISSLILFQKQREYRTLRLAIGAPSSPMLSNILMMEFDSRIYDLLAQKNIRYTRYADDLTFSAPRTGYMHDVIKDVISVLKSIKYPRLYINKDKTSYVTPKYRRSVTGLVLTNDGLITIGHKRKRELHAAVHQAKKKFPDASSTQRLAGMLAYVNAVEPSFLNTLKNKYGPEIINKIQKYVIIQKK